MTTKIDVGQLAMGLALHPDLSGFKAGDKAIDNTVAKIKRLAAAQAGAKQDAQKLGEAMGLLDPSTRKLKEFKRGLSGVGDKLGTFSNYVMASMVAAGVAATYTLAHWSEETFKLGHHLEDTSKKTGLGTDAIQEWRYAAQQGGTDAEALEKGAVKLEKSLDSLSKGKGPAVDAMRTLGISLKDPAIKAKNLEQIMYLVANAASRMADGPEKTAAFMKLFGKAGADLIPVFDEGVLGVKKYGAELRNLGGLIDSKSIGSLAEMDQKVDKLKTTFEGLKNRAVIALLPHLSDLADRMLKWVEANQAFLDQRIHEIMDKVWAIAVKIGAAFQFAADHWEALAAVIATGTVLGTVANIATAIGGIVTAVRALSAGWAVMGASGAAGATAMLGPLAAVAAALASIWYFQHRMSAHDERDTIAGKNSDDVTWGEAAQLRVEREAAPDVDSITIAPDLNQEQLKARRRQAQLAQGATPEGQAAIADIAKNSFGAKLNNFLGAGLPTNTQLSSPAQGTDSGAAGPLLAAQQSGPGPQSSSSSGAQSAGVFITAPQHSQAPSNTVTYSPNYSIKIDAAGMTPDQLQQAIDNTLKEHDERSRRETAAALGVTGY